MTGELSDGPNCPLEPQAAQCIEMAHGGGGRWTQRLIDELFRPAFSLAAEDLTHDGAVVEVGAQRLAFSTDSYVVRPLFFPGGDIGSLAVNGTVNDLAMCGAEPLFLSVGLVLEEGLALADLERVAASMAAAACQAGVRLVTGDTKVVERGRCDGLYVNTAGVGRVIAVRPIRPQAVRPGDVILLSGDIGRHGMAIMAEREGFGFETPIVSDCAPLAAPVRALLDSGVAVRCLRDLTRGGLATALIEIACAAQMALRLEPQAIPVCEAVRGACEILGFDPLYVANEGRFVAFVPPPEADAALQLLRSFDPGAQRIGTVAGPSSPGTVHLRTLGGSRVLDLLSGEQLPRIC